MDDPLQNLQAGNIIRTLKRTKVDSLLHETIRKSSLRLIGMAPPEGQLKRDAYAPLQSIQPSRKLSILLNQSILVGAFARADTLAVL